MTPTAPAAPVELLTPVTGVGALAAPTARRRGIGVIAVVLTVVSVVPAAGVAVAAAEAPWSLPLALGASVFGIALAFQLVRGRRWARTGAIAILVGTTVEALLFAAVNVIAFGTGTVWALGVQGALVIAAVAAASAVVLLGSAIPARPVDLLD